MAFRARSRRPRRSSSCSRSSGPRSICCLALTVDNEAVVQRLLKRAQIEGRADDNEATIRERMRVYDEQTAPLLGFYRGRGRLVEVSGMGTVEAVGKRIREALS